MSRTREGPRLREALREAQEALDRQSRLLDEMRAALGMGDTTDPVAWCRSLRARLDVLEAFRLAIAGAMEVAQRKGLVITPEDV